MSGSFPVKEKKTATIGVNPLCCIFRFLAFSSARERFSKALRSGIFNAALILRRSNYGEEKETGR